MRRKVIEMREVRKTYKAGTQDVKALDGISMTVMQNEYIAIMGPSGSGKSTLLNILGCLDIPASGKYLLNGQDVGCLSDDRLAAIRNREIGFVFQSFHLLPRYTACENVELPMVYAGIPARERKERAREALRHVFLEDRMHHLPGELSGGQKQRVALARALVNRPSILLADEPTGNLDSATSKEIMKIFRDIHEAGNTILLVTHEMEIARYAQRIVTLRDGRIETDRKSK